MTCLWYRLLVTTGAPEGAERIEASFRRLRCSPVDLGASWGRQPGLA
jgi:hypothetical protein